MASSMGAKWAEMWLWLVSQYLVILIYLVLKHTMTTLGHSFWFLLCICLCTCTWWAHTCSRSAGEHCYFPWDHVVDEWFGPVLIEYRFQRCRRLMAIELYEPCQVVKVWHALGQPLQWVSCWCMRTTVNSVCESTPSKLFAHAYPAIIEFIFCCACCHLLGGRCLERKRPYRNFHPADRNTSVE